MDSRVKKKTSVEYIFYIKFLVRLEEKLFLSGRYIPKKSVSKKNTIIGHFAHYWYSF